VVSRRHYLVLRPKGVASTLAAQNDSNEFSLKGDGDTHSKDHPRDEGGDEEAVGHSVRVSSLV
jgi:hypothetical protein